MAKRIKISGLLALISGLVSFAWLIYNYFAFEFIRPRTLKFAELGPGEVLALFIWIGFLIAFLFHLIALFTIIFQFQYFKKVNFFRILTLLTGVISFILLINDWGVLGDIGKEYQLNISTAGEWKVLYYSLLPHGLFHLLMFGLLYQLFRDLPHQPATEPVLKDEIIFIIAQYVGILCGLIGMGFTVLIFIKNVPVTLLKLLIPFYGSFIIFPYGLIAFYWLLIKRTEKPRDWYDEKQWQDVTKAALTTLILSIPGMSLIFFLNYLALHGPASIMWFPFYLFLVLFLFSSSTLYFSKKS